MTIDVRFGDAFAGLAELDPGAVDVTLADPPYDRRAQRGADLPFPPLTPARIALLADHLARVTRRWIVVFCAERQVETWATALEDGGARFVRLGFALKNNPMPQRSGDRPASAGDPVVICHGSGVRRMRWNGGGRAARWETAGARYDAGGQVHPSQKPLPLIRALVEAFSEPGELVMDPMAGSGTTAIACRELGRRFLGWELSPDYHAIASMRIERIERELAPVLSTDLIEVGRPG